jgi:hypothetical protein
VRYLLKTGEELPNKPLEKATPPAADGGAAPSA